MGLVVLEESSQVGKRESVLCIAVVLLDIMDSISYYACLCLEVARYMSSALPRKGSDSHE